MKSYVVVYSAGAREDIAELEDHIEAKSSSRIARHYIMKLLRECDSLALGAYRGSKRSDLRPNMRIIGYKRAVSILFRREEANQRIVILGTTYRGRSVQQILARDE